jgi:AraC-like DNA-binding protein
LSSSLSPAIGLHIEEAKQLLETTTQAVESIGRDVGYEDVASFRRLFRRLTGMTPGEYRRKFQPPGSVVEASPRPSLSSLQATALAMQRPG